MEEQNMDVQSQETVQPEKTDVKEVAQEPIQQEQTAEHVEVAPALESGITPAEDVDEKGVPYKNRYMEEKRKREKTNEELREIKELIQASQTQQQPRKYTEAELKAFVAETDDAQHRLWALNELDKIHEEKFSSVIKQEFQTREQKQRAEATKQQAFNSVLQRNPEIFLKDAAGNFAGWNTKSPLFQRVNQYMNNPEIANRPDGILVATRFAKADLYEAMKPNTAKKLETQTNEIKDLQKKTMIEGAGSQPSVNVKPSAAAIEKGKTGKLSDNIDAMKSIMARSGILAE